MGRKNPSWLGHRAAIAGAVIAGAVVLGAGQGARADVPCAWLRFNLPVAGSSGLSSCTRSRVMGGGTSSYSIEHRRWAGSYFVDAGASVPLPE